VKSVHAFSAIVILIVCLTSLVPLHATTRIPAQTMTVTSIVRVPTTIILNVTFTFQAQSTYNVPVLVVDATLVAYGNGLSGVIDGQSLDISSSWDRAVGCITNSQGMCSLTLSIPPLGGANTLTAVYAGTAYFAPCAVTKIV